MVGRMLQRLSGVAHGHYTPVTCSHQKCGLVVETYTAGNPGRRLGALPQKGLMPLVKLKHRTALKGDRDGPGVTIALQPPLTIWVGALFNCNPLSVEFDPSGR